MYEVKAKCSVKKGIWFDHGLMWADWEKPKNKELISEIKDVLSKQLDLEPWDIRVHILGVKRL